MTIGQQSMFGRAPGAPVRRAARQTDRALSAVRRGAGLEPTDAGHVALLRTVAELIDREVTAGDEGSAFTAARLVAEWRALWAELVNRRDAGIDDELRAFFAGADVAGDAALRDTP